MAGLKQVFVQGLTERSTTEKDTLGDIRMEGSKWYKYIKFNDGAADEAGVAGEACGYYLLDGYKNNEVTSDVSDCTGLIGAGILQAALALAEYGWIQIKGAATLTIALGTVTDGIPLSLDATNNGQLDVAVDTTATNALHVCAHAGDASDLEIICEFPI